MFWSDKSLIFGQRQFIKQFFLQTAHLWSEHEKCLSEHTSERLNESTSLAALFFLTIAEMCFN